MSLPAAPLALGVALVTGDIDNDGDTDALLSCVGAPPVLLRNDGGNRNHWLAVSLVGSGRNREAVGARVAITVGDIRREANQYVTLRQHGVGMSR